MGGAQSKNERVEEKREAAPAKRREIRKLESMQERLAFFELHLWRHDHFSPFFRELFLEGDLTSFFFSREDLCPGGPHMFCGYSTIPFTMGALEEAFRSLKLQVEANERYEKKREDPPAKRRVITKLESMEERLVFIEWNHWSHEPGPHLYRSSSTIPFTMSGVEEDEWTEEKSEAASAKRREIRKLESMEERLAFIQKHLRHHFRLHHPFFFPRECLRHHVCPDDFFFSSREYVCPPDPDPNIILRTEKEREDSAKELEIRTLKLMEEYMAFRRQRLSSLERGPFIASGAEEKREDSAKERELRKLKLMEEYMAFRRLHLSSLEPVPIIPLRSEEETEESRAKRRVLRELVSMEESIALIRSKFSPEKIRAGSPASSCESMKSDRSMTPPLHFKPPEKIRAGSPASSSGSTKSDRSMTPPLHFNGSEEETEDSPAKIPEIMELVSMEESIALIRKYLLPMNVDLSSPAVNADLASVLRRKEQILLHRAVGP